MDEVEHRPRTPRPATPHEEESERLRAKEVQRGFLQTAPEVPGFLFATRFEACADVSGDFYEFIRLPDGRIGFAQGDVSGHGMHAALIMSMAKKTLAIYAEAGGTPSETLARVNESLVNDLGGKIFISMVYAILDPDEHIITLARAGHNPVIRYNTKTNALAELKPKGMVVGMKAGGIFRNSLEEQTISVESGDVFVVYTDGITETMNRQQVEYGVELLTEVVRKYATEGPERLINYIMDSVRQFRGGGSPTDDATILVLAVD
jgi:phosphoserine phosphatase RsbU/P